MSEIRWEDPPVGMPSNTAWLAVAEQLRSRPGVWAVVRVAQSIQHAGHTAQNIKRGRLAHFSLGQFDAVARLVDGEARVYARYIGETNLPNGKEGTPS